MGRTVVRVAAVGQLCAVLDALRAAESDFVVSALGGDPIAGRLVEIDTGEPGHGIQGAKDVAGGRGRGLGSVSRSGLCSSKQEH